MADTAADNSSMESNAIELATELTIAWLNNPNNRVAAEDVPTFLRTMHSTLNELSAGAAVEEPAPEPEYKPAVSPRSSVKKNHIISLIDGKPYKTLKRHLSGHGLTPAEYRQRYGLKADYPMVAPDYSAARSEMARKIGLGNKGRNATARTAPAPKRAAKSAGSTAPKAKRGPGRPRKAAAAPANEE